jgi:hypothetical protein
LWVCRITAPCEREREGNTGNYGATSFATTSHGVTIARQSRLGPTNV